MNSSNYYRIYMLMVCFSFGLAGFVNAKQDQRPYSLQNQALKKNKYYYYPRQNVYLDPVQHVYFVWEKTHWKSIKHLPERYVSVTYSSTPRFALWISSTHPYYYNVEHRKTYYEYRVAKPATVPKNRVESKPKANVSFHLEINPPHPVYVEEHYVVVRDPTVHHHHHGNGHGRGHGHGKYKGHGHH